MTRMYNPPHPGEVLRDGVFTGTGITVTAFAKRIGVTRVTLSNVLNGKNGISADMAVRLAAALGGSNAATWACLLTQNCVPVVSAEQLRRVLTASLGPTGSALDTLHAHARDDEAQLRLW